ncbi:MAG: glycosyltransferase family 2 protein [bacterium]
MKELIELTNYVFIFISLYFEVFLLMSLLDDTDETKNDEDYFPYVDVIVPVFNEEKTISKTIDSLLALDYPRDKYNIVVVNDGSTDNTLDALKRFHDEKNIIVFSKKNEGKHTALNLGITNSKAEFVGCLDADSFVDREALKLIVRRFRNASVMAVTPSVVISDANNIIRKTQMAEYQYGNFVRKAFCAIGAIHIAPGPFSFYRKSVFEKVGMYRKAHNTEDMEMAMRLQKNRLKIVNEPKALVYTVGPNSIKKLYKQRVRWVSGFLANLIDYKGMVFNKKYGDLGLLVLPFAALGVFLSFFLFIKGILSISNSLWREFQKIYFGGLFFHAPNFDWFYLNNHQQSIYF